MAVIVSFLMGVVAGLRTMTAPAAVVWVGKLGRLDLAGSWTAAP